MGSYTTYFAKKDILNRHTFTQTPDAASFSRVDEKTRECVRECLVETGITILSDIYSIQAADSDGLLCGIHEVKRATSGSER